MTKKKRRKIKSSPAQTHKRRLASRSARVRKGKKEKPLVDRWKTTGGFRPADCCGTCWHCWTITEVEYCLVDCVGMEDLSNMRRVDLCSVCDGYTEEEPDV